MRSPNQSHTGKIGKHSTSNRLTIPSSKSASSGVSSVALREQKVLIPEIVIDKRLKLTLSAAGPRSYGLIIFQSSKPTTPDQRVTSLQLISPDLERLREVNSSGRTNPSLRSQP